LIRAASSAASFSVSSFSLWARNGMYVGFDIVVSHTDAIEVLCSYQNLPLLLQLRVPLEPWLVPLLQLPVSQPPPSASERAMQCMLVLRLLCLRPML
jgi:hypothetical protein